MALFITFLKALSVFLGTVIGVGIFGLPFVSQKAGFFITFLYFVLMTLIVLAINFLYAKIILGTEKNYRLPGYVGEYLGKKWKKITFFIIALGLIGALLAYLIIGGEFLTSLFSPYFGRGVVFYTLLFFVLGTYLVFRDIKAVSGVELLLLILLLAILFIFFIKAFPVIKIDYFKGINLKFLSLPYGVILFALWGAAIVPEIKELLRDRPGTVPQVIFWGTIFSAIIYLCFIFIVLGVSGPETSKEAISGLAKILGENVVKLGFAFGVITCFTSFLTLGLTLKKIFWYDFGFSKNLAWFLTCSLPLVLFLLGLRQFIEVVGFTGAIALGLEGIIIVFLYRAFLKKKFSQKMNPAIYFFVGIFALGIILEIFYFLW